ncbi:Protein of unknown function (DUF2798) [Sphaerochaeta pleomorpha str. Grapes]|uniref:DUF2798 domain-containing protein n=1 Tax=Sphaerochaeta pleomorpha (strain ATCC BAA-1885 / DSM 22778 / Grapes) TaxID=158190 RepID=G8QUW0_SPHPG|nr:DUF2798 domain-containing protein [Sphaerochaeta pleomorpha]AEV28136.1 Protein of unknown function (DUF2798) [Sphaerochaeta pleomorpha str. Grapes]
MPSTKLQRMVFAFLTVAITVHVFVFYNLAIEMGGMSNQVFIASKKIILIEFIFAFLLEILIAGPLSEKLAFRVVNSRENKPFVVTTAIICATVALMCPMMSFIATILYNGFSSEFISQWMQKIVFNFPLAFFSELFFIQPLVRFLSSKIFKTQLKRQAIEQAAATA